MPVETLAIVPISRGLQLRREASPHLAMAAKVCRRQIAGIGRRAHLASSGAAASGVDGGFVSVLVSSFGSTFGFGSFVSLFLSSSSTPFSSDVR
jgi:hypothetical protein